MAPCLAYGMLPSEAYWLMNPSTSIIFLTLVTTFSVQYAGVPMGVPATTIPSWLQHSLTASYTSCGGGWKGLASAGTLGICATPPGTLSALGYLGE